MLSRLNDKTDAVSRQPVKNFEKCRSEPVILFKDFYRYSIRFNTVLLLYTKTRTCLVKF